MIRQVDRRAAPLTNNSAKEANLSSEVGIVGFFIWMRSEDFLSSKTTAFLPPRSSNTWQSPCLSTVGQDPTVARLTDRRHASVHVQQFAQAPAVAGPTLMMPESA